MNYIYHRLTHRGNNLITITYRPVIYIDTSAIILKVTSWQSLKKYGYCWTQSASKSEYCDIYLGLRLHILKL